MLKQKAEEMKSEIFVKRFSKPKSEDIHVISVDKHYEPYVLIDAKYRIEYYIKRVYSIEVTDKTKEVRILGEILKPQILTVPNSEPKKSRKVVNLEGQEWSFHEDRAYFILDKTGKEISPDKVPIAPSEENPKKLLKEFRKNTQKVKISNRKIILMAKTKLVKRPSDIDTIDNEMFQVTEYATIYNPIYLITFRNMKNKEEKIVKIDGVTAEVIQ